MNLANAIAFKEWAVVCAALGSGQQSLILRKGGIHEGRGGFRVAHSEFWLFPTEFHQPLEVVSPIDSFREFLLTKKMLLTPERERVVNAIFESPDSFDADQWIDSLAGRQGAMLASRSTVYRTLNLLEEAGLIRKVVQANDREVYERIQGGLATKAGPLLREVMADLPPAGEIRLREYVVVERVYEIHDESRLPALIPWHIWSMDTVRQRFHYKTPGLFALLVRAYRLSHAVSVPDSPAFAGCRSWVELPNSIETSSLAPVISDSDHQTRMQELERLLQPS